MKHKNYLALFLLFLCILHKPSLTAKEVADYVIIGVGTAGAPLAKFLTDDKKTSVIAIHNGKNLTQDPDIKFTRNTLFTVVSAMFGSSFYQTGLTTPQPNADDRELFWALSVVEGGASSINAGAWARGTDEVYSQWEAIAGPEWSTTIILDIYKSLENYKGVTPAPAARGFNGPLEIRQIPIPTPFSIKFTQAEIAATGFPFVVDYNDPNTPIGISSQLQYTQRGPNGVLRESSVNAFLNKNVVNAEGVGVNGRKLTIKLKSTALRTIWQGNKAVGVEYYHDGKIKKAYASKGVIVCGGLYSSAFLMHSGVGPKQVLKPLGIPVKFDNPNVGKSLADQVLTVVAFTANPDDTPISSENSCVGKKFPNGLTFNGLSIQDFLNVKDKKSLLTSLFCDGFAFPENSIFSQIAWLPAPGGDPTVRRARITTSNPFPGFAIALVDLVQPLSVGRITIDSFNPFKAPVIDSGIFTNPADLALYVQVFQTYLKNINAALQALDNKYELIFPPAEILDDVELTTAFIKENAMSNQCWQGHCRMAPLDQGGVVDSRCRVYGVENLYVADDSINPVGMDGTPMATAYLIAANLARLLLQ